MVSNKVMEGMRVIGDLKHNCHRRISENMDGADYSTTHTPSTPSLYFAPHHSHKQNSQLTTKVQTNISKFSNRHTCLITSYSFLFYSHTSSLLPLLIPPPTHFPPNERTLIYISSIHHFLNQPLSCFVWQPIPKSHKRQRTLFGLAEKRT